MGYATITGQLKDSDGTAWSNATWTAVPVSPSSKPVFPDGSPVPTTGGLCDATGHFSGQIPTTIDIRPPGTTLTITITSMTSAPPLTLTKVQIVSTTTVDLGALLSPRLVAPRIKAGPIVYAYNSGEVTNPVHGNGYVNTVQNQSYIYMQNSWIPIGVAGPLPANVVQVMPHVNEGDLEMNGVITADRLKILSDPATTQLLIDTIDTPYENTRFACMTATPAHQGGFQFDGWNSDFTKQQQYLLMHESLSTGLINAQFFVPVNIGADLSVAGHAISAQDGNFTRNLSTQGLFVGGPQGTNSLVTEFTSGLYCFRDAYGTTPTNYGTHSFRCNTSDQSAVIEAMLVQHDRVYCGVPHLGIGNDALALNVVGGSASISSSQPYLYIQATTEVGILCGLSVNGNLSATGAKTFNIPHPLGGERRLVHACLEGPESGVYYRGEAELVDGRAIVELPDYFEALTQADGRTVQLTQVDDGGELGLFAASPVVDGKFSIRSNVSAAVVSWEVKAERRDLPRLDVEPATKGERSESES
jgi:hypothetical protein